MVMHRTSKFIVIVMVILASMTLKVRPAVAQTCMEGVNCFNGTCDPILDYCVCTPGSPFGGCQCNQFGAPPATPEACSPIVCGNGAVEASESCDDGGTIDGDGCSSSCTVESGYTCDTSEPSVCVDINECTIGTDDCHVNAVCSNTLGSFNCTCNLGYTGDGVNCVDQNECVLGTDNCDANATCANTSGGFTCSCNPGFAGDGVTCVDINECAIGTDNCSVNGICSNTLGSFTCECGSCYSGDGVVCVLDDADGDGVCDTVDVCPGFDDSIDTDFDGIPDGCDLCAGGAATGDTDANGSVDVDDHVGFELCLIGPNGAVGAGCECFDFDGDLDVDLPDFAAFCRAFSQ